MYVGRRYSSPRVIDLQLDQCVPMNESTPEPHDPPTRAETHLLPVRAAACARAAVQMSECPRLHCSAILHKNDHAQKMVEHNA
jgi:hypothetical protein